MNSNERSTRVRLAERHKFAWEATVGPSQRLLLRAATGGGGFGVAYVLLAALGPDDLSLSYVWTTAAVATGALVTTTMAYGLLFFRARADILARRLERAEAQLPIAGTPRLGIGRFHTGDWVQVLVTNNHEAPIEIGAQVVGFRHGSSDRGGTVPWDLEWEYGPTHKRLLPGQTGKINFARLNIMRAHRVADDEPLVRDRYELMINGCPFAWGPEDFFSGAAYRSPEEFTPKHTVFAIRFSFAHSAQTQTAFFTLREAGFGRGDPEARHFNDKAGPVLYLDPAGPDDRLPDVAETG